MKNNQLQKNITIVILMILGLLTVNKLSYAQTWIEMQNQVKDNTQNIKNIDIKIIDLKDNYKLLYEGAKNQNDQLGNLISYSGYILAILGLILAWYINRQYEKVKEMKEIVKSTKKYIDEHNHELYKRIKRDETVELLNRLKEVPEDITNIGPLLLSRDLFNEDYHSLKESYLKMKGYQFNEREGDNYVILLTQHFAYESLKDEVIRPAIVALLDPIFFHGMFNRDIKNFLNDTFKFLNEFVVYDEQVQLLIKNLFFHYSESKFKENIELQNYIKELFSKYNLNKIKIYNIAKEQAPNDPKYVKWLDLIFK